MGYDYFQQRRDIFGHWARTVKGGARMRYFQEGLEASGGMVGDAHPTHLPLPIGDKDRGRIAGELRRSLQRQELSQGE